MGRRGGGVAGFLFFGGGPAQFQSLETSNSPFALPNEGFWCVAMGLGGLARDGGLLWFPQDPT